MKIPFILVGCGKFSLQRLEILINSKKFEPTACVDLNVEEAKQNLKSNKKLSYLANNVFKTISDAKKNNDSKVCFIYATSNSHTELCIESLNLGMHTLAVKSIATNKHEFKNLIQTHKKHPDLLLVQGLNNQWNEAATQMINLVKNPEGIGKLLGGQCICWGRQNLNQALPPDDVTMEGMFYYSLACHQLSQLVAAKGLPKFVTSYSQSRVDEEIGYKGVFGTSGGQCIFEYGDGVPFSYTGTRAGHGNPFGFASRWSGNWIFHGENGDLKRDGGRVQLYKKGNLVQDLFLKDLDNKLIEDESRQFNYFYDAILDIKKNKWIQENSLDTWILMDACNESSIKNKKISVEELKKYYYT
tara:strand:- start:5 stop:1075 length:1071 start_codon:yes stop_codon:yes gene_type:complete